MRKEDYDRLDSKLDKHTAILMSIQDNHNKEISLLKLAHQRLKYTVMISIMILTLTLAKPEFTKYIALLV